MLQDSGGPARAVILCCLADKIYLQFGSVFGTNVLMACCSQGNAACISYHGFPKSSPHIKHLVAVQKKKRGFVGKKDFLT